MKHDGVGMIKNGIMALAFSFFSFHMFGQEVVIPPELKWWLQEVQKANPDVSISKFKLVEVEEMSYDTRKIDTKGLYPVFNRWKYSGDKFAYYDLGMFLTRGSDGRYHVSGDIDSCVGIFDRNGNAIFTESFGSSKGINGLSWLRDTVLIAVGIWIRSVSTDKTMIDLFIREYRLEKERIVISEYEYRDAFDAQIRSSLDLEWWQQRSDYFLEYDE